MTLLFKQLKLQVVVEGTETQPNMLDPNYPKWEDKDLVAKLEIMSNLFAILSQKAQINTDEIL